MNEEKRTFILPPQLTVEGAAELKDQLDNWLPTVGKEVICSGREVRVLDTVGLQLLLALYKSAVREGKKLVIVDPSPELKDIFNSSGVDKVFELKEVG